MGIPRYRGGLPRVGRGRPVEDRPDADSWPRRLPALRQALGGITRAELAARVGVSQRTMDAWEQGYVRPGVKRLPLLYTLEQVAAKNASDARAPADAPP